MVVLCDLDGIVVDLLDEWLKLINKDYGTGFTKEHITDWDMHKILPMGERVYDYIRKEGVFSELEPIPGAIPALIELNERHDVYIVSTPSSASVTSMEKLDWCAHYLPFLNRRQIILCGAKELIRGDWLIDDSPDNLSKWKVGNHPWGRTATIDYEYNKDVAVNVRAKDYRNTTAAWEQILDAIGGAVM